ncbi:H-NS histone family protein [Alcanivorax sp.]|uniref:H-NS histone family protein n=1 Tax=Alcanivorax sp. TaxID=1872427 RepID=UPI0025859F79|nr:H-NS histone family protein [Alcanivorax sp.]
MNDIEALARQKKAELRRLQRELEQLEALKSRRLKVTSPEIKELARSIQSLAKDRMMETEAVLELIRQAIERYPLKGKGGKPRGTVPPKYRNPDNPSETWTGRGRKPRWVVAALERGLTLDDLRIRD